MLDAPMTFAKVRVQTKAELKALELLGTIKSIAESELIDQLIHYGFSKSSAQQAIIYLINGYEIRRNKNMLELITWQT